MGEKSIRLARIIKSKREKKKVKKKEKRERINGRRPRKPEAVQMKEKIKEKRMLFGWRRKIIHGLLYSFFISRSHLVIVFGGFQVCELAYVYTKIKIWVIGI